MKNLNSIFTLVLLTGLASCNPSVTTEESGKPGKGPGKLTPGQIMAEYRHSKKGVSELFEVAQATATINPCIDTIDPVSQIGTNGKFKVNNNHDFDYENMSATPSIVSECNIETPVVDTLAAGKVGKIVNTSRSILESGDYTVVIAVNNASVTVQTDAGAYISVLQTESAFGASATVLDDGNNQAYYSKNEHKAVGDYSEGTTVVAYSFNRVAHTASVHGFNTKLGEFRGVDNLNPASDPLDMPDVTDFSVKEISVILKQGETKGLLYFAVFPKILSEDEKKMLLCYGMFMSGMSGKTELLEQYASTCGIN